MIAAFKTAYCGTSASAIDAAAANLGAYNNFGDTNLFSPGTGANGKAASNFSNKGVWNTLP